MVKTTVPGLDTVITKELLKNTSSCKDGFEWTIEVIGKGMTLEELLPKFERADWMLWTLKLTGSLADKIISVRIAIKCAEAVIHIYEKRYPKDDRPRKSIEAAIAYVKDPSQKNRQSAAAYANATVAYVSATPISSIAVAAAYETATAAATAAATDVDTSSSTAAIDASIAATIAKKGMHKKLCAMIIKEIGL